MTTLLPRLGPCCVVCQPGCCCNDLRAPKLVAPAGGVDREARHCSHAPRLLVVAAVSGNVHAGARESANEAIRGARVQCSLLGFWSFEGCKHTIANASKA